MDTEEVEMTYDLFYVWSAAALQDYCAQRGFPTTGSKKDLAAMAYTAYRTHAEVQPKALEKIVISKVEYKKKCLLTCGRTIEDPLSIKDGWVKEKESMHLWPAITYGDIVLYLKERTGVSASETLNAYKEGKAFSYFQSNFVKEINFLQLDKSTCILKTFVSRSTSLNDIPHRVWACVSLPEGNILSAYCSCTAGLHQTCNHLVGMLFRVEAAASAGMTNSTCTSRPSTWVVPAAKTVAKLGEINNFDFVQPAAGKTKSRPLVAQSKHRFVPSTKQHDRKEILPGLVQANPNSLAAIVWKAEQEAAQPATENSATSEPCGTCMPTSSSPYLAFDDYIAVKGRDFQNNQMELREHVSTLRIPDSSVRQIERETRGQVGNDRWAQARRGRITASNFHDVKTRMKTLDKSNTNRNKETKPLLARLMGYNPVSPNIPALKYGRENEEKALNAYVQHQASLGHKGHTVTSCGLFVCKENVFLGASPDGLTSCECCGKGIVEVKCPYSIKDDGSVVSAECLAVDEEGNTHLKRNHRYFTQIQGQLAIVGVDYCDFVVYNPCDIHVERILFDKGYWSTVKDLLCRFYSEHLLPECITHAGRPSSQIEAVRQTFKRANFMGGEEFIIPEVASNVTLM